MEIQKTEICLNARQHSSSGHIFYKIASDWFWNPSMAGARTLLSGKRGMHNVQGYAYVTRGFVANPVPHRDMGGAPSNRREHMNIEETPLAEPARRSRTDSTTQTPRKGESYSVPKRLLGYAKRGAVDPAQLTALEMQQVCFAFILEYERKGIK